MGRPKQLLSWGDTTVLGATIATVRGSCVAEIVLVLGAAAETIRGRLSEQGIHIVLNPVYAQGMATSLHAGLSALSPHITAALVVLADQPFVRPQTLDQLIAEHRRSRASIVIPTHQGKRGNPVLLDRSLFPEVMQLQGDVGCRAIFARHQEDILNVEVDDGGILLDIDSQEDYRRLREGSPRRTGE